MPVSPPAPVKVEKLAEERGEQLSMKERIAALEKIAAEKKKREQEAIAERKAKTPSTAAQAKPQPYTAKPSGYVPPPPKGGVQIPAPTESNVKTFAVSTGDSPWMMTIPGVQAGPKVEEKVVVVYVTCPNCACKFQPEGAAPEEPVDDGMTPQERRKNELEEDPGFKKYRMMKKMGVLLVNIRKKIL